MKCGLMVAAALLILSLASPVMALTQDEAQQLVTRVGCPAQVTYTEWPMPGFNAYYSPMADRITAINFDQLPDTWQRLIIYHEAGHCLQQHRYGFPKGHDIEWDADQLAIKWLTEDGFDGAELNDEIWSSLYRQYSVIGEDEEEHGLVVHRVVRGRLNRVQAHIESV